MERSLRAIAVNQSLQIKSGELDCKNGEVLEVEADKKRD